MELLVIEGVDRPGAPLRSKLYPSEDSLELALPKLRDGALDLVFVRHEACSYLHYQSVCFADGRPWRVSEEARRRVEALFATREVCGALLRGQRDAARAMMLSLLEPFVVDLSAW